MRLIANSSPGALIRGYGEHHVTVLLPTRAQDAATGSAMAEQTFEHAILLQAEGVIELGSLRSIELNANHCDALWSAKPEVVLLGTTTPGPSLTAAQRALFLERGIGLEIMTLGAACRTYNLLAADGRAVAALLFPQ